MPGRIELWCFGSSVWGLAAMLYGYVCLPACRGRQMFLVESVDALISGIFEAGEDA